MISIIVPIYNTEKYLDRCIQSILAQIYTDFELLLVDDGSTDSSGVICERYAELDSRVRVFHKKNGGASSARNIGLDNANGEWVMFVDSDDYLRCNALDILYRNIGDNDVVVANSLNDTNINGKEWAKLLLECKVRCEIWGGIYKRDLIRSFYNQIPLSIVIGEDFLTNLTYALKSDCVKFISENIYLYNTNNTQSLVNSYQLTLEHEKILLSYIDMIVKDVDLAYSVFRKKYLTLERLVYIGQNPYQEDWVKELKEKKVRYSENLGLKENILLSLDSAIVSRCLLRIGMYVKGVFKNILYKCKNTPIL